MPATIRDVASRAGVGLGTVSRVLNQSPHVSPETRQRVEQAIEALDFRPSVIARRLSLGKTLTIGAIVPFLTRPATVERLRGVEISIVGTEYDLIVFNIETPERRDHAFAEIARRERADGILVVSLPPSETDLARFQLAGIPTVFIDVNHPDLTSFSRVVVDDVDGGRKAVEHLIGLGHRRIGYIFDAFDSPFSFSASRDRYEGYLQGIRAADLPEDPDLVRSGAHGRYEAKQHAHELLTLDDPPTAIFAASDTQALGAMEAGRELGRRIPEDLSVIGYDDVELAGYLGLTTIRQHLFASGERGIHMLLDLMSDPLKPPMMEVMPTDLIVRSTTAPLGSNALDRR